jgi:cytochrome c-type biogenesis protein CcmH/NrfG
VSRRTAWIAGTTAVLLCAAGASCALLLKVTAAHNLVHAAEGGDVDRVLAAIEGTPNDSGLWELLGEAHAQRADYARAVQAYQKSIQLDPSDENTWWMMGIAEVCRQNAEGIAATEAGLRRLNGESAKEYARIAPRGCCAFGGCAK